MGQTIGEAYINIMPSTENFGGGLTSSLEGLSSVAAGAGAAIGATIGVGVAGVTALTGAVTSLAEVSDNIDKSSQKLGVSAEFYQEWDAVLQHSGTSMDSMSATFKKLATASQNASADQQAAFEALGLSMEQVSQMSSEELFTNVISGLQGMEEGTERTALATTLLGRNAMEMGALLNTSSEDTQKMIDTVHELGGVLSDDAVKQGALFQDNLQDLQTAMDGLKNGMLSSLLPGFNDVLAGLTAFISGQEGGLEQVSAGIQGVMDTINDMMPELLELAGSIIKGLAESIISNLPSLMETGLSIITSLGEYIISNLPMLIETAITLLVELANYLTQELPVLIPAIVDVMLTIVEVLTDNIDMLIDAAIQLILALANGLIQALPVLISKIPVIIQKTVSALVENAPKLLLAAENLLMELARGMVEYAKLVIDIIPDVVDSIKNGFLDGVDKLFDVGNQLVQGLWDGISDKADWLIDSIKGLGEDVLNAVKEFLGIHSPSKVFRDEVGQWIPKGIAVGIETNADSVTDALNGLAEDSLSVGVNIPSKMASQSYKMASSTSNDDVMNLLATYLPIIANKDTDIVIEGDAQNMFKVIREQNRIFKKSTGVSAFA